MQQKAYFHHKYQFLFLFDTLFIVKPVLVINYDFYAQFLLSTLSFAEFFVIHNHEKKKKKIFTLFILYAKFLFISN